MVEGRYQTNDEYVKEFKTQHLQDPEIRPVSETGPDSLIQNLLYLIGTVILVAVTCWGLNARFGENDQFHQLIAVRGWGQFAGTSHIPYSSKLLGYILHAVYSFSDTIPAYSVFLVMCIAFCLYSIFMEAVRCSNRFLFLLIAFASSLSLLQTVFFTSVAEMCSFSGMLLLHHRINHRLRIGGNWRPAVLLTLGIMLRYESFLHAAVSAVPLILMRLFTIYRIGGIDRRFLLKLLSFALALMPALCLRCVDLTYQKVSANTIEYSRLETWNRGFTAFFDKRVSDYLPAERLTQILEKASAGAEDIDLYRNLMLFLPDEPRLDAMAKAGIAASAELPVNYARRWIALRDLISAIRRSWGVLLPTMVLLVLFPGCIWRAEIGLLLLTICTLQIAVCLTFKTPPWRIYMPAFWGVMVLAWLQTVTCLGQRSLRHSNLRTGVLVGLCLLLGIARMGAANNARVSGQVLQDNFSWMLSQENAIFVQVCDALGFEMAFPAGEGTLSKSVDIIPPGQLALLPDVRKYCLSLFPKGEWSTEERRVIFMFKSQPSIDSLHGVEPRLAILEREFNVFHGLKIASSEVLRESGDCVFVEIHLAKHFNPAM